MFNKGKILINSVLRKDEIKRFIKPTKKTKMLLYIKVMLEEGGEEKEISADVIDMRTRLELK